MTFQSEQALCHIICRPRAPTYALPGAVSSRPSCHCITCRAPRERCTTAEIHCIASLPVFCAKRAASLSPDSPPAPRAHPPQSPINEPRVSLGASAVPTASTPRHHWIGPRPKVENSKYRLVRGAVCREPSSSGPARTRPATLTSTMLADIPIEVSQAVAAAGDLYLWGIHKVRFLLPCF